MNQLPESKYYFNSNINFEGASIYYTYWRKYIKQYWYNALDEVKLPLKDRNVTDTIIQVDHIWPNHASVHK